jgi:hypothetical protein
MNTKMSAKLKSKAVQRRSESGFSLLEYVAGATVLVVVVWGAMTVLGGNLKTLVESLGEWAVARSADIESASTLR